MRCKIVLALLIICLGYGQVKPGIDVFFEKNISQTLQKKRIGLVINHTSLDHNLQPTIARFRDNHIPIAAIFTPEHGFFGNHYANEKVGGSFFENIRIYSLHGKTKRPTEKMLKEVDVLIYDIQDIGTRSYTYISTLFYVMEEAKKYDKHVIVLDRPNPLGGLLVDGPMLEEKWRSFIGYINIPYCHGMTVGELAKYFNEEYNIHCNLTVVPMDGWKREMTFAKTGLVWMPPSPHIPESSTAFFYPATGILGELGLVNIGIGYTLPFKILGAPWIEAQSFAERLNEQKLPGVIFLPFHFKPFYGKYQGENCHGVMINITDEKKFRPLMVQYLLIGMLKSLYPQEVLAHLEKSSFQKKLFCMANGNEEIYRLMKTEKYPAWKMISYDKENREKFLERRQKYLLYQ